MTDDYLKIGYQVDRYYELEEDFLEALKYMPLEIYDTSVKRKGAKSTYLADLLLRIGSNIDIVFRKMIMSDYKSIYDDKLKRTNDKRKNEGKEPLDKVNLRFNDYMELENKLDPNNKLSNYTVTIIQTKEHLTPFKDWVRQTPTWWSSYNKVKHHAEFDEANLDNVIQALAALLLLVCMNNHSIKMLNYGYLCIDPKFKAKIILGMRESKHDIITKVFISPIKSKAR